MAFPVRLLSTLKLNLHTPLSCVPLITGVLFSSLFLPRYSLSNDLFVVSTVRSILSPFTFASKVEIWNIPNSVPSALITCALEVSDGVTSGSGVSVGSVVGSGFSPLSLNSGIVRYRSALLKNVPFALIGTNCNFVPALLSGMLNLYT